MEQTQLAVMHKQPPFVYAEDRLNLEQYLSKSKKPFIMGHITPDGDSIGSCLGLATLLRNRGCQPFVATSGHIPNSFMWLDGANSILNIIGDEVPEGLQAALEEADLFICLDFNQLYRVGATLEKYVRAALEKNKRPLIMVDHHEDTSNEFDFVVSRPEAAATCELLTNLFAGQCNGDRPNEISPAVASSWLTGIITDTGQFNHSSSYPEIFITTAHLLQCGADKDRIVLEVFHRFSEWKQRLTGYVLCEKVKIYKEYQMAFFTLSLDELKQFHVVPGDTEGLVNKPLDIDGVEISIFLRETVYEGIKVSMRSKGKYQVKEIASACFGGGGHLFAAGAEYAGTLEEASAILMQYIQTHALIPA